jgi:hypothetical protein
MSAVLRRSVIVLVTPLVSVALLVCGLAAGQDLTNDELKTAFKEAVGTLEAQAPAGEQVLREDYFRDKFKEAHQVTAAAGTTTLTMRDSQRLVLAVNEVAKAMLAVAGEERATSALYQSAWSTAEPDLLKRLGGPPDGKVLLTPNLQAIWLKFLQEWRAEVVRVAPDRFRDALRQAAYSLLRIGLDTEDEWIKKVQEGGFVAAPVGGAPVGTGYVGGASPYYPWMYHRHYRIMNRIERHHYRHAR